MDKRTDFLKVTTPDPHKARKKQLYEKYGEKINALTGPNPWSALIIVLIVAGHLALAWTFRNSDWWKIVVFAWLVGAFFSHALYVFIHEATHNLVLRTTFMNKVMNLVCDIPLIFPSSHGFRKYHMQHHRNMGVLECDADIAIYGEAKLVGTNPLKKFFWLTGFMFVQLFRATRIKGVKFYCEWVIANLILVFSMDVLIFVFWGPKAFGYLALSTIFALGMHPLGGRWIQEHYQTREDQETYSYYGILNNLTFNIGYHVEHHDIMTIPWNNLPKLKRLAPELYNDLDSYNSWGSVVFDFITNKNRSPFDRILR